MKEKMIEYFIKSGLGWILRRQGVKVCDHGILHSRYIIEDFDAKTGALVKHQEFDHNCFLNEGINEIWSLICGTGGVKFDNTNAYIEVGDDDTAAAAAQTGLLGANKFAQPMDATYPTYGTSQKATFRATFATGDANFAWKEITIINGDDDAHDNLNRKVQAMGTKTSAVSRVATVELSIT
jgi:hypothetical protein